MTDTKELAESLERGTDAVKCECGGYCEACEYTDDEARKYGCGRELIFKYQCCVAAFKCVICGTRYVGRFEAPDMDFS